MKDKIIITLSISRGKSEEIQKEINYKNLIIQKTKYVCRKSFGLDDLVEFIIIYSIKKTLDKTQIYDNILEWIKKNTIINEIFLGSINNLYSDDKKGNFYNIKNEKDIEESKIIAEKELQTRIDEIII